jgi:hypothetical protein
VADRWRRRSSPTGATAARRWRRLVAGLGLVTTILILGSTALLALEPRLVDAGFVGWLDLPLAQRLALHVPLALCVVGGGTVAVVLAGWVRRWWRGAVLARYAALAAATLAVVAQLGAWSLVGWGFS